MAATPGKKGTIRIGTRGSRLARWQAEWVADRLRGLHPGLAVELIEIKTQGDRDRNTPLAAMAAGGHRAVHQGDPAGGRRRLGGRGGAQPEGPAHAGPGRPGPGGGAAARGRGRRPDRADSPDARRPAPGARVGTSSPRRRAQLLYRRPDLDVVTLRGNVETRLNQALDGRLDAVVLAWAGLHRLGLEGHVTDRLEPPEFLPAVGQGRWGSNAGAMMRTSGRCWQPLDDPATHRAVRAERAALAELEGGCIIPMAAWARDVEGIEGGPTRARRRPAAGDRRRRARPRRPRTRRRLAPRPAGRSRRPGPPRGAGPARPRRRAAARRVSDRARPGFPNAAERFVRAGGSAGARTDGVGGKGRQRGELDRGDGSGRDRQGEHITGPRRRSDTDDGGHRQRVLMGGENPDGPRHSRIRC